MSLNKNDDIPAHYLYCIAEGASEGTLPPIKGIDDSLVYPVNYRDIVILVHDCRSQPYGSQDEKQAVEYVLQHEDVIEKVSQAYANVLPFAFNTIVTGTPKERTATDNLLQWIEERYSYLKTKLEKIRGKKEYVVQVFMDSRAVATDLMATDPELKTLHDEIAASPKGKAFFIKEKTNALLKQKLALQADAFFHDVYGLISQTAVEFRAEKIKPAENEQLMLMNLSCLADPEGCRRLGEVLDEVNSRTGINVRFTGPWPPYSFV